MLRWCWCGGDGEKCMSALKVLMYSGPTSLTPLLLEAFHQLFHGLRGNARQRLGARP
jgi:hypothetical protein